MSEQTTHAKLDLEVEVRAAEQVRALKADLDSVLKTMKAFSTAKSAGIETRAARQRRADARAEAADRQEYDVAGMNSLRRRFGFEARMQRQRAQEEAAAERERRTIEAATMRDLRENMAFATRMNRQRVAETRPQSPFTSGATATSAVPSSRPPQTPRTAAPASSASSSPTPCAEVATSPRCPPSSPQPPSNGGGVGVRFRDRQA